LGQPPNNHNTPGKKLVTFDTSNDNDLFGAFAESKPKDGKVRRVINQQGLKNFTKDEDDLIDLSGLASEMNKKKGGVGLQLP
jgi:hypothetical protein